MLLRITEEFMPNAGLNGLWCLALINEDQPIPKLIRRVAWGPTYDLHKRNLVMAEMLFFADYAIRELVFPRPESPNLRIVK